MPCAKTNETGVKKKWTGGGGGISPQGAQLYCSIFILHNYIAKIRFAKTQAYLQITRKIFFAELSSGHIYKRLKNNVVKMEKLIKEKSESNSEFRYVFKYIFIIY